MIQKQMTLAALVALFIAGNAGIANAESGISGAAADEGSSAAMEADWAATHGNIVTSTVPLTGARAHASARQQITVHKVSPEPENGAVNQHD
jgi:hypothetical protein